MREERAGAKAAADGSRGGAEAERAPPIQLTERGRRVGQTEVNEAGARERARERERERERELTSSGVWVSTIRFPSKMNRYALGVPPCPATVG